MKTVFYNCNLTTRLILLLLTTLSISAQSHQLKRVLILDYVNISENPDYGYLSDSITEAVKKKLSSEYVYAEMPLDQLRKVASRNYLDRPEDYFVKSVGLQLGLYARQDIVIGGGYRVEEDKLKIITYVVDVGKREYLADFNETSNLDAGMFEATNRVAIKTGQIMQSVLPGKGEFKGPRSVQRQGSIKNSQLSFFYGSSLAPLPAAYSESLKTVNILYPYDIEPVSEFTVEYRRLSVFINLLHLWGRFSVSSGEKKLSVPYSEKKASADVTAFQFSIGAVYSYFLWWRLYLEPDLGFGLYSGTMQINYSELEAIPVNPLTGQSIAVIENSVLAPTVITGLNLTANLPYSTGLFMGIYYRALFFTEDLSGAFFYRGGVSYKF